MIVVETDRVYAIYTRTNRRVRWQYADYQGRQETPEKAVEVATERITEPFEYWIEDITTGEMVTTGFVNWEKNRKAQGVSK